MRLMWWPISLVTCSDIFDTTPAIEGQLLSGHVALMRDAAATVLLQSRVSVRETIIRIVEGLDRNATSRMPNHHFSDVTVRLFNVACEFLSVR